MSGGYAVVGGGAWGTALAIHLARRALSTRLWMRETDLVDRIRARHDNPLYLPGVVVPPGVEAHADLADAVRGAGTVLAVVPSPYARQVYGRLAPYLTEAADVVVATKGIEEKTLALPLAVAAAELGAGRSYAALSGPTFAIEVAREQPTAVVVAGDDGELTRRVQHDLSCSALRVYTNGDPIGVQVSGALKNVIALASGVAVGLGMGDNAVAALITRGLAEMSRLGRKLGGSAETFRGLAGLGDLVLTCTGEASRNRQVGRRLGRGERLRDILGASRSVPEGVRTTISARDLARREGVEMPIVDEVHRILFEDGAPGDSLRRLMGRPLIEENVHDSGDGA